MKLATKGNYYTGPEEPRLRHLGLLFFLWPRSLRELDRPALQVCICPQELITLDLSNDLAMECLVLPAWMTKYPESLRWIFMRLKCLPVLTGPYCDF